MTWVILNLLNTHAFQQALNSPSHHLLFGFCSHRNCKQKNEKHSKRKSDFKALFSCQSLKAKTRKEEKFTRFVTRHFNGHERNSGDVIRNSADSFFDSHVHKYSTECPQFSYGAHETSFISAHEIVQHKTNRVEDEMKICGA
ncbi:CLUMA_CG012367, isoform A [Clunio marinus]|uniref:CLUMA_CG012367, isoform A n=1 Tax=Clunio marinus TaxID=568069 RepID=A0A1J1IF96_9DIPT|nr:CLUMA_CG012367, isoform A [Clunio marinus]